MTAKYTHTCAINRYTKDDYKSSILTVYEFLMSLDLFKFMLNGKCVDFHEISLKFAYNKTAHTYTQLIISTIMITWMEIEPI